MTDVAFAAGFSSVRQFNDTIQSVFATSPTALRARVPRHDRTGGLDRHLILRLPFRQPLCPDNLFGHLAATAVPGVEEVRGLDLSPDTSTGPRSGHRRTHPDARLHPLSSRALATCAT